MRFVTENRGRTLIKICGIMTAEEAGYLIENGVDFAGMVMYFQKSRRCIDEETAAELVKVLGDGSDIKKTAVVVSPTAEQVRKIADIGFDYVQIHGELTEKVMENSPLPILKAFNVSDLGEIERWNGCEKIAGYVFDAADYGSGKTFDWSLLENIDTKGRMFLLAGGLSPENVIEAVKIVHPDGVDVSSGVEFDGGSGKDPKKIRDFCRFVRNADKW